jgi:phosphate:Na+ symporter
VGLVLALLAGLAARAAAADKAGAAVELDLLGMSMGLVGGLALFLFGMGQMAGALKALAGERLKGLLARLTTHRVMGVLTGALVTGIIQSSSVTTVLTIGFITAGVLSLSQAVGIIFGANIGTTLTAQIIAFKITHYSLLLVGVGFGMLFAGKQDRIKQWGTMLMGLGLVFFGMEVMSNGMQPLRSYPPFLDLMAHMESPLLGIAVATLFTGLVQSSSATTGIVIAMAGQGLITLPAGISLIFGANIGTCVTALLAAIGKPREAMRASLVHLLFNVLGVALWVGFIDQLAELVAWLSPVAQGASGVDKLAAETPRQIANAHTVFNVATTLIFLPLSTQFARLVERLVPDREAAAAAPAAAAVQALLQRLDPSLLMMPSVALEQARDTIRHMADVVRGMFVDILPAFMSNDEAVADHIMARDEQVDVLDRHITDYLISITRRYVTREQSEENARLLHVVGDLEHIGDVIERNLVPLLRQKAAAGVRFSEEGRAEIEAYHRRVLESLDLAIAAFTFNDLTRAQEVAAAKVELAKLEWTYRMTHYRRLSQNLRESAESSQFHLDLIDYLRRIDSYATSIAQSLLECDMAALQAESVAAAG